MVGSFKARIRQALDYFFGEVIWRYGSSIIRPIAAIAILALVARSLRIWPHSRVRQLASARPDRQLFTDSVAGTTIYGFSGWDAKSLLNFLDVGYFYLTAPAGGSSATPVGWVKLVFIAYVLLALWLIALVFDAFIRKVGTSR
jgi:hypothetical protein